MPALYVSSSTLLLQLEELLQNKHSVVVIRVRVGQLQLDKHVVVFVLWDAEAIALQTLSV